MNISIFGAGFVGLVSGACLAEKNHRITLVDIDGAKINKINQGTAPFFEPGLSDLIKKHIQNDLTVTQDRVNAILETDISLICVGTPLKDRYLDLGAIQRASAEIGNALIKKEDYHLIVLRSTVPPETTEKIIIPTLEKSSGKKFGKDFGFGVNPEFLRTGEAIKDFMEPGRIVLGGEDHRSLSLMEEMYRFFSPRLIFKVNFKTAEMVKLVSNVFLANLISFSNEVGNLCSRIQGMDGAEIMKILHQDRRFFGEDEKNPSEPPTITNYLMASGGFGGSCLPKDLVSLMQLGEQLGFPLKLMKSVHEINEEQPEQLIQMLRRHFEDLQGLPLAVLGLSFKENTSDLRGSPSLTLIQELLKQGAKVRAYDPFSERIEGGVFEEGDIKICDRLDQAIQGSLGIFVMTPCEEFIQLSRLLKDLSEEPVVIDGRRFLDKKSFKRYEGIGLHNNDDLQKL